MYPYLNGLQNQPQAYLEAFFRVGLDDPSNPFFSHLPRWVTTSRLKTFFCGDLRRQLAGYSAIDELRDMLPPEFPHWHPLSRAQYLEAAYLLPGYILSAQGDRVAMAHAVEGRFPFLDHRVVEFAAKLPPRTKLRGLVEKSILRQSLAQHLPDDIAHRPKQPYRAPDSQSFVGDDSVAEDYVQDMLSPSAIDRAGYFDARAVGRLLEKCRHAGPLGFRDNMAVVGILSVQLLHEQFVMGAAPKHVPAAAAAHPTPGAAPAALG
jgi:asparagine synthase (glutamine-hydrolysing)